MDPHEAMKCGQEGAHLWLLKLCHDAKILHAVLWLLSAAVVGPHAATDSEESPQPCLRISNFQGLLVLGVILQHTSRIQLGDQPAGKPEDCSLKERLEQACVAIAWQAM